MLNRCRLCGIGTDESILSALVQYQLAGEAIWQYYLHILAYTCEHWGIIMKFSNCAFAAVMGATMAVTAPGTAGARVHIFGSVITDSSGYASATLPPEICLARCEYRIIAPNASSILPEFIFSMHVIPKFSPEYDTTVTFQAWKSVDVPHTFRSIIPIGAGAQMGKLLFGPATRTVVTFNGVISSIAKFNGAPNSTIDYKIAISGAPEPSTWALMILGFGGIGAAMRRRGSAGRRAARVSYSQ